MKHFRIPLFISALLGLVLSGFAQKTPAQKALIKRTYYDYAGRQLHEEYQYIKTANQLVVKQGYYKEYTPEGVIKAKATYRNDELDGTVTTYENWGNGPEPLEIDHYKAGKRHGYSALYWFSDAGKRLLEHEGYYYNGKYDGRWVQYEHNGSKLMENWRRGIRHGETIQYDTGGQAVREGYFNEGEPFSGILEEHFDNGKLSSSIAYEDCFREGPTRTWYPSGKIKTLTQYRRGQQDGPTLHYSETDEPEAASKTLLAQVEAATIANRADSIRQVQTKELAAKQAIAARRRQDSLQVAETRMRELRQKAYEQEMEQGERARVLVRNAAMRQAEMRVAAKAGYRPRLQAKLYVELYAKLLTEFEASHDPSTQLAKAERLQKLLQLAVDLESGKNQDLNNAIGHEGDSDKILALTDL